AGRQADPVRVESRQLRAGAAALHDRRERHLPRAAAAAVGLGSGVCARWQPARLRADAARVRRVEALSRRRHHADLAGVARRLGGLALFDLKTGQVKQVPVQIAGDLPEVRARMVNVSTRLGGAHLSPNATRALFEARGEIITVPAEKGDPRNITNSPKVMERT